jgi:hypothetical protein
VNESVRVEQEVENVVLEPPAIPADAPVIGGLAERIPEQIEFHPLLGLVGLVAAIVAPLAITGALIAFLVTRLDRQAQQVKGSERYQAAHKTLEQKERQEVQALRAGGRGAAPRPAVVGTPRWSVISTALLILTFTWFIGVMLAEAFFPAEFEWNGQLYSYSRIVALIATVVMLALLFFLFRRQRAGALDSGATDYAPVPWGWIWVILSGLVILGVGLGLSLYFRSGAAVAG